MTINEFWDIIENQRKSGTKNNDYAFLYPQLMEYLRSNEEEWVNSDEYEEGEISEVISIISDSLLENRQFKESMNLYETIRGRLNYSISAPFMLADSLMPYCIYHEKYDKVESFVKDVALHATPENFYMYVDALRYLLYRGSYEEQIYASLKELYQRSAALDDEGEWDYSEGTLDSFRGELAKVLALIQLSLLFKKFQETGQLDLKLVNETFEAGKSETILEDGSIEDLPKLLAAESPFSQLQETKSAKPNRISLALQIELKKKYNIPFLATYELLDYFFAFVQPKRLLFKINSVNPLIPQELLNNINRYQFDIAIENENSKRFAVIWGLPYLFSFLYQQGVFSEITYQNNIKTALTAKKEGCFDNASFKYNSWRMTFLHTWERPEHMTEAEFEEEAKYIQEKYHTPLEEVKAAKDKEVDELLKVFDFDKINTENTEALDWDDDDQEPVPPMKKPTKQYGRNEKVSVKYNNGEVKENVKFKKVEKDIEKGLCQIV